MFILNFLNVYFELSDRKGNKNLLICAKEYP